MHKEFLFQEFIWDLSQMLYLLYVFKLLHFPGGGGGELVDFYDGGDHVHIWGLRFWGLKKNIWGVRLTASQHIWGLRFWGLKSNYLYFPERTKIFVNELGSLERKVFQNIIVNKWQFFFKIGQYIWGLWKIWSTYLGVWENGLTWSLPS